MLDIHIPTEKRRPTPPKLTLALRFASPIEIVIDTLRPVGLDWQARHLKILVVALNYAIELVGCSKYISELDDDLVARGHRVQVVTGPTD